MVRRQSAEIVSISFCLANQVCYCKVLLIEKCDRSPVSQCLRCVVHADSMLRNIWEMLRDGPLCGGRHPTIYQEWITGGKTGLELNFDRWRNRNTEH